MKASRKRTKLKKALTVRATRLASNHNEVVERGGLKKALSIRATRLASNHNDVVVG